MQALEPYEIWFTGLRREQSPTRKNLQKVEQHRLPGGKNLFESESSGGLDLATGMGLHHQQRLELSTAIRSGLFEHRLRAMHKDSR